MNTSERRNQPTETIVTCVYCGMAYPQGTPTHGATVLTEHIKVCEKHPMRLAEKQLELTRQQRDTIFEKLEQAESRMKQLEDALRQIVSVKLSGLSYDEDCKIAFVELIDVIDIAKAALEEKQ